MARLDRYRIGIPRELSEIRTQPWLSEGSLTCDPYHHRGPRLAPMWQQSGTLLFCSCHGIAGFLVDELQI